MLSRVRVKQKSFLRLSECFFVYTLIILFFPSVSFSQDKIYKTDNTIIEAKVQEVGDFDIKYKKFNNLNGPVYIVKKENIRMIIYENGDKEVYNQVQTNQQATPKPTPFTFNANTADQQNNDDLIVTVNGDNLYCTIDRVINTMISYHIKRRGSDPKGNIPLSQVIKYYYKEQWYYGSGINPSAEKARNFILSEKINDAISSYFLLISTDSTNATLLAEDAYALALGGIYDAALMRLDRSWSIGANSPDVNYFTAQVFALMGYDELANEFWKETGKYNAPEWIVSSAAGLQQKFKRKFPNPANINSEEIKADFKHANELASRTLYFQAIGLFHKIIDSYPNEYLPYLGYSITLEKTGALERSAQAIEKAISLIGNNPSDIEKKQSLEQHLNIIRKKIRLSPTDAMPGLFGRKGPDAFSPQIMAYAGGMFGPSLVAINGRIGYYLSGSSNASFDIGWTNNADVSSVNVGLSGYFRKKSLVCGAGLLLNAGNTNTTFSIKISLGISIRNKSQTSSLDIFLDGYTGLTKNALTTVGLSIGKSIYFGKRK